MGSFGSVVGFSCSDGTPPGNSSGADGNSGAGDEIAGRRASTHVMGAPQRWCRIVVVGAGGEVLGEHALEGPDPPGLGAVDHVARVALLATRLGGGIVLHDVSAAMRELLDLAGLDGAGVDWE